jgi:hypothetical protein
MSGEAERAAAIAHELSVQQAQDDFIIDVGIDRLRELDYIVLNPEDDAAVECLAQILYRVFGHYATSQCQEIAQLILARLQEKQPRHG